jgi:hypothetical protein
MRWNELAAIIGYWRNGMTLEEISIVSDISPFDAERIIFNYQKGVNQTKKHD